MSRKKRHWWISLGKLGRIRILLFSKVESEFGYFSKVIVIPLSPLCLSPLPLCTPQLSIVYCVSQNYCIFTLLHSVPLKLPMSKAPHWHRTLNERFYIIIILYKLLYIFREKKIILMHNKIIRNLYGWIKLLDTYLFYYYYLPSDKLVSFFIPWNTSFLINVHII